MRFSLERGGDESDKLEFGPVIPDNGRPNTFKDRKPDRPNGRTERIYRFPELSKGELDRLVDYVLYGNDPEMGTDDPLVRTEMAGVDPDYVAEARTPLDFVDGSKFERREGENSDRVDVPPLTSSNLDPAIQGLPDDEELRGVSSVGTILHVSDSGGDTSQLPSELDDRIYGEGSQDVEPIDDTRDSVTSIYPIEVGDQKAAVSVPTIQSGDQDKLTRPPNPKELWERDSSKPTEWEQIPTEDHVFSHNGNSYTFPIPEDDQELKDAVSYMEGLLSGKHTLQDLSFQQKEALAIALSRYNRSGNFIDNDIDEVATRISLDLDVDTQVGDTHADTQQDARQVVSTLKSPTHVHTKAEAAKIMERTHRGLLRFTIAEIIDSMIDPNHSFGAEFHLRDKVPGYIETFIALSRRIDVGVDNPEVALEPHWRSALAYIEHTEKGTVIGEYHSRALRHWRSQDEVLGLFRDFNPETDFLFLEDGFEDDPSTTKFPTWQGLALQFANRNNINPIILDDWRDKNGFIGDEAIELFLECGLNTEEVVSMDLLRKMIEYDYMHRFLQQEIEKGTSVEQLVQVLKLLSNLPELYDTHLPNALNFYARFVKGDPRILGLLNRYVTRIGSKTREAYWTKKILPIVQDGKKALIIVGNGHRGSMASLLKTGEVPFPLNSFEVIAFRERFQQIKDDIASDAKIVPLS